MSRRPALYLSRQWRCNRAPFKQGCSRASLKQLSSTSTGCSHRRRFPGELCLLREIGHSTTWTDPLPTLHEVHHQVACSESFHVAYFVSRYSFSFGPLPHTVGDRNRLQPSQVMTQVYMKSGTQAPTLSLSLSPFGSLSAFTGSASQSNPNHWGFGFTAMRHLVLLSFSSCGAILDTHRQYLQTEVQIARNDFTISVYCRIVALVHGSSFPIWGDMLNSLLGYHGKYTYPRPLVYAKRFVEVLATPHRHHATQAYTTNFEIVCSCPPNPSVSVVGQTSHSQTLAAVFECFDASRGGR